MPRPTIEQIRTVLVDLGLPQVDPSSWFDGTMPETLRVLLDAGPLKPQPAFSFQQRSVFSSLAVASVAFDITGANPGTIRVLKNLTIRPLTANIEEIRIQKFDGTRTTEMWRDATGPFAAAQYIGTDNAATRAWGALGLNNIVMYPPELTDNPNSQRQVQIVIISAAAVIKDIILDMTVVEFDSRLFKGGDW